jgi:putative ABC transport system permease protein
MSTLFGLSMTTIMVVLLALFAVCIATVGAVFLGNRVMFRMGLRNAARRRAQAALVVIGLMLATLIITAAFATGDSLDYSITNTTYVNLQRTDLSLHHFRPTGGEETSANVPELNYANEQVVPALTRALSDDPDIEGFMPFLYEVAPAMNPRTKLVEPAVVLSGLDPAALDRFGGLRLVDGGRADLRLLDGSTVYVNERAADKLEAQPGDTVQLFVQGMPREFKVAGVVKEERASGTLEFGVASLPGIVLNLPVLQELVSRPGQISGVNIALYGDIRSSMDHTDAAAARLETLNGDEGAKAALGLEGIAFQVEKNKQDAVDMAVEAGNAFTTIFLVMGLFSIAAGVMLIFMIFVMLAAERKMEMGIARAVGAKRAHLVESFISEGMAYDLLAGAAGAVLGVAAAFWLIVTGARVAIGEDFDWFVPHVSSRTLIVSYCLGVVLTFLTVVISSLRISRLNIVAAVRGTDEAARRREGRQPTRWLWVALGIPALVIPPLGLYWLLRKGFGLPWAWILGPIGLVSGVLLIWLGVSTEQSFPFTLGVSLLPLSSALLATYYGVPGRITWTAVGVLLGLYWLTPESWQNRIIDTEFKGGMEMFVLSGIMIVTAFTLVIVFNAPLLTVLTAGIGGTAAAYRVPLALAGAALASVLIGFLTGDAAGGLGQLFYLLAVLLVLAALLAFAAVRFPNLAPALKMGVAYPIANRFRTGMTIAMFSLIMFSLVVMSIINASFLELFAGEEAKGGWDVAVATNRTNPLADVQAALAEEGSFDASQIVAQGRTTAFDDDNHEVRRIGDGREREWATYSVRAGDDAFWANNEATLDGRARGYESDRAVYEAVRTTPGLAVIDSFPMQTGGFSFSGDLWRVDGVTVKDGVFEPFEAEFRDLATGRTGTVTVIGVLSSKIPQTMLLGLYTNEATFRPVYAAPQYYTTFLRLTQGMDGDQAAKSIEAALVTQGVQADSIQQMIDDVLAQSRGIMRIFQVFMGLGLLVGIAALGVIAFRSVVERRQQIGMLRAIGYHRGTVATSFLLESTFIASMGILSGVVGAAILSYNLLNSSYFASQATGLTFFIPWLEVVGFIVIAFGFALLMTWWPSRRAAGVPIAEALRYE